MGVFDADKLILEEFSPPLGLNLSSCAHKETTLLIKPATFSQPHEITDAYGRIVVLCESSRTGFKKKIIHPSTGEILYTLDTKLLSRSLWGKDGSGREVLEVSSKDKRKDVGNKSIMFIRFTNVATALPVELTLDSGQLVFVDGGGFSDTQAKIMLGDRVVGTIKRDTTPYSSAPFVITVAAGVDLTLMCAVGLSYGVILARRRTTTSSTSYAGAAAGGGGGGC